MHCLRRLTITLWTQTHCWLWDAALMLHLWTLKHHQPMVQDSTPSWRRPTLQQWLCEQFGLELNPNSLLALRCSSNATSQSLDLRQNSCKLFELLKCKWDEKETRHYVYAQLETILWTHFYRVLFGNLNVPTYEPGFETEFLQTLWTLEMQMRWEGFLSSDARQDTFVNPLWQCTLWNLNEINIQGADRLYSI